MSHHHSTLKYLDRALIITAILLGGSLLSSMPALAASPTIENQSTGSYTDDGDGSTKTLESNKVSVTVAEIAGITVTQNGTTGTPNPNSIVYFSFTITNVGNDPTQFYLPKLANLTGNATQGNVEITGYNLNGTTPVTLTTPLAVTTAGQTGSNGTTPGLLTANGGGIFLPGGTVTVRVPVTINSNAANNDPITVQLGDTAVDPASTTTPQARLQNQPYTVGSNDLYTVDNPDNLVATESAGIPFNNIVEASAVQSIAAIVPLNFSPIPGLGTCSLETFDTSSKNWRNKSTTNGITVNADYGIATWNATEGNPGGTIKDTDRDGQWQELWTPDLTANNYSSDYSSLIGKSISFDYKNNTGVAYNIYVAVKGTNGQTYFYNFRPQIINSTQWTRVVVPMDATQWTKTFDVNTGAINGTPPTSAEFLAVLSSIDHFAFSIEGQSGPDTTLFDNFGTPCINAISISGKVWNDRDASANNTFTGINNNGEVGTNAVFGTTIVPVNAILVNVTTGNVLATQVVAADGTYSFASVPANTNVKIILSPTAGTVNSPPPTAAAPVGWVGTSPTDSGSFNTGFTPITDKDFGIRQKAKLVLLKRITKINGQPTNPNDGTVLNAPTTDTSNPGVNNWPSNYLFGTTNAGKIKPNDTIEYTVYFLNNQGSDATVRLCDPIRGSQDYVPNTIQLQLGNAVAATAQTDAPSTADNSHSYSTGNAPTNCNAAAVTSTGADNGGIAIGIPSVDATLPAILGATGSGTPTTSYGLFRFTTKVKP
jgi:hypothetical protein